MILHIGIFPPKEVLDVFRDINRNYVKQKRNLKLIPIDQMNIVLKNVGSNVTPDSFDQILEELNYNSSYLEAVEVKFKNLSFGFEKDSFPKILFYNVEATEDLKSLADSFHQIVKNIGQRDLVGWKEAHSNKFHINLAKLKKNGKLSNAKILKDFTKSLPAYKVPSFLATEAYLVETVTGYDKSINYKKVLRIELKKPVTLD